MLSSKTKLFTCLTWLATVVYDYFKVRTIGNCGRRFKKVPGHDIFFFQCKLSTGSLSTFLELSEEFKGIIFTEAITAVVHVILCLLVSSTCSALNSKKQKQNKQNNNNNNNTDINLRHGVKNMTAVILNKTDKVGRLKVQLDNRGRNKCPFTTESFNVKVNAIFWCILSCSFSITGANHP